MQKLYDAEKLYIIDKNNNCIQHTIIIIQILNNFAII